MASNDVISKSITSISRPVITIAKSGYPLKIFVIKLDSKFLCMLCCIALRDPMQSYCSHRMCRVCLQGYTKDKGDQLKCPACEKEETINEFSNLTQVFPDRALHREMMRLEVVCEFAPECTWNGKLKEYNKHLEICLYRVIDCVFGCGTKFKQTETEDHNKEFLTKHLELLYKKVTVYEHEMGPNGVDNGNNGVDVSAIEIRMSDLSQLLENLQLDFTRLESVRAHQSTSHTTTRAVQNTYSATHPEVDQVNITVTDLQRRIEELNTSLVQRYEHLMKVKGNNERDMADIDDLQQKSSHLERSIQLKELTLEQLETRIVAIESTSYDGHYIFRVPEWSRKSRDATNNATPSIYSAPFYTSRSGYKLCLRLYANGDGMGRGTHISLFFVVMRGPHDAILQWPFRQKVTFTLLDQTGSDHVVESFRPDPTSSSFRKPVSEMNIASGCPLFVPLSKIQGRSKYVVDDVLFVKVIVDNTDI